MLSRQIVIHPNAVSEAQAALDWYRERSDSAANAFITEMDHAVERILQNPEMWPLYIGGTKRFVMQRFPFSVVYRQTADAIQVLAFAHAKRKPGYWKKRK
jgi:plasmid stabilization system protein ParE